MAPSLHQPTKKGSHLGPASNVAKKAHSCLKPRPPPGPCPSCGIKGHWKVDCPNPPSGIRTFPLGPEQESSDPALPRLLRLATEVWRCPGPQAPTLIASMEPRVTLTVAGKLISFLIDTGHLLCYACLLWKNQGLSGLCYGCWRFNSYTTNNEPSYQWDSMWALSAMFCLQY